MAENQENLTPEAVDDAFADATPQEVPQESAPADGESRVTVDEPAAPSELDQVKADYAATQKAYADGRIEFYQMQAELKALKQQLADAKPAVKEEDSDDAKTLADLIASTNKTLDSRIDKRFQAQHAATQKELQELKTWRAQQERDNSVDAFMSKHPEVTTEDEHAILRIIQDNPWIATLPNTPTKLNTAFSLLVARDPKGWAARGETPKNDPALEAAKAGASALGGAKGGSKKVARPMDEFDAVLEEDKQSSALWR